MINRFLLICLLPCLVIAGCSNIVLDYNAEIDGSWNVTKIINTDIDGTTTYVSIDAPETKVICFNNSNKTAIFYTSAMSVSNKFTYKLLYDSITFTFVSGIDESHYRLHPTVHGKVTKTGKNTISLKLSFDNGDVEYCMNRLTYKE